MNPERWRQIEALYHAAVEKEPAARAVFLAQADPELRVEVESLLAQRSGTNGALEGPGRESAESQLDATVTQVSAGTQLGPYKIEAPIGAGGMGEVFRAIDTRLHRTVAIKILPRDKFADADRKKRFLQEARASSALNHPNIVRVYDIAADNGTDYLVMEYVPGKSLDKLIAPKGIPVAEALGYAEQIANGLAAAHAAGIVHRDIKPANVIVTSESQIKILDFGLAKLTEHTPGAQAETRTLESALTEAGTVMGTVAYMSPEQARGQTVDRRADIWAFGVVLYELLTGRRPFRGATVSDVLGSVLKDEPDWDRVPANVRRLLRACLEKDAANRLQWIGDWRHLLSEEQARAAQAPARTPILFWGIAAALGVAALALAFVHFRETPSVEQTLRYSVAAPENSQIHSFALSPDGRTLAIAVVVGGKSQLWLRPMDELQAQPMAFTEDATYPFWSPDSRYIGFFAQDKLKKIAASGGSPQTLCDAAGARGGSWGRDDVIIFHTSATGAIQRVAAAGGVPTDVTKTRGGDQRHPVFLPDGRHFLFWLRVGDQPGIYVGSLDGQQRRILNDKSNVVFAPALRSGLPAHVLFVRGNTLMAVPFEDKTAEVTGEAFPVAEGVSSNATGTYLPVAASGNGTLVYSTGGGTGGIAQLTWVDRSGKQLGLVGEAGQVMDPALSPDEKLTVFRRASGQAVDLWVRDLARGTERRFTSDPSIDAGPIWSPKGDVIVFGSTRNGRLQLYEKAASSSGSEERLMFEDPETTVPQHWSKDGRFIVYSRAAAGNRDLWILEAGATAAQRKPFAQSPFDEFHGQFSPDSHWMAFTSDRSGRREVYVRPFPESEGEYTISTGGGEMPRWRGDGKELFFEAADRKLMAVSVKSNAAGSFEADAAIPLFDAHMVHSTAPVFEYNVTSDGKRFLINTMATSVASAPPLTVVTNWQAGLKN